jgi:hypothetical protein
VPGSIEDRNSQVLNVDVLGLSQGLEVLSWRTIEIDYAAADDAARNLIHISVRAAQQFAALGERYARQSVRAAGGGDKRTFERIDCDIDFGASSGANDLAAIEEVGLALFALADELSALRIASQALRSAIRSSPLPMNLPTARADDSVARTTSSARLRSTQDLTPTLSLDKRRGR